MSVQSKYPNFLPDQREFFDTLISEDWHTYHSIDWDITRRYEINRLFGIVQPRTILDIGCGCGFHDLEMARYPFVESVHAIDYSSKSIEKADEVYPHPKVKRWVGDLFVDKPVATYDLVVSFQVIEHLADPDAYFRYCAAALRPGGYAAVFTPNLLRLSNRIRIWRGLSPVFCDPQHYREYRAADVVGMVAKQEFSERARFGYGFSGAKFIDKLSVELRLQLGAWLPSIANGICIILRKSK